jgi:hypothetical protein
LLLLIHSSIAFHKLVSTSEEGSDVGVHSGTLLRFSSLIYQGIVQSAGTLIFQVGLASELVPLVSVVETIGVGSQLVIAHLFTFSVSFTIFSGIFILY